MVLLGFWCVGCTALLTGSASTSIEFSHRRIDTGLFDFLFCRNIQVSPFEPFQIIQRFLQCFRVYSGPCLRYKSISQITLFFNAIRRIPFSFSFFFFLTNVTLGGIEVGGRASMRFGALR